MARSFSLALNDLFKIDNSLADLDAAVSEKYFYRSPLYHVILIVESGNKKYPLKPPNSKLSKRVLKPPKSVSKPRPHPPQAQHDLVVPLPTNELLSTRPHSRNQALQREEREVRFQRALERGV